MKIGDIAVDKRLLVTVVGKTTDGKWIVEYADGDVFPFEEDALYLVEESNGLLSED